MNPLLKKILICSCTIFLWAGMCMADVIHIGTFDGNDNFTSYVESLVEDYNLTNDTQLPLPLTLLGKWEIDEDTGYGAWEDGKDPEFTGSFFEGGISGTWSAPQNWANPLYYSFKAATEFALYYANGETSGTWTIDWEVGNPRKPNTPDLSHIAFWTAKGTPPVDPPNPVPEPGTLALVGLGLASIAGYRRKRHTR